MTRETRPNQSRRGRSLALLLWRCFSDLLDVLVQRVGVLVELQSGLLRGLRAQAGVEVRHRDVSTWNRLIVSIPTDSSRVLT